MIPGVRFRATRRRGAAAGIAKQSMVKAGRFAFANNAAIPVTGWTSDPTFPATIVGDDTLDVVGAGAATVRAMVRAGRNNTSGTPTVRLVINGVTVDSVDIVPTSLFGNTDPLRGRPCFLQWTGTLAAGDDIRLDGIRTVSTTGYVNDGSEVVVEPGNTTVTRQRMYKNTSTFTCANSRGIVTGWTADTKYPGGTVSSNQLATTLAGVGTARAYVVGNSSGSPAEVFLMMNGVEIGMITIAGGDQSGYWIEVPGVTFDGSDLLSIETRRTNSSSTRALEDNSLVVEASV
ncbi:hypothetical protein SEA_ASHERTHEMAN_41 [Gordonia phage Ashertheman]|uniref:Minor tail protein n=1 Tax=Gordonia phage Ashertheman TaxID=2301692 RepID=A0A385DVZ0_9CAUD|nr:hypothetical protein J1764_gp41 [Gordonia phage Ashertheman]AXQ62948.1 hypothetical protein SEA_ASHERTHEMAN_41 [Gordonia phage Ashertheman]